MKINFRYHTIFILILTSSFTQCQSTKIEIKYEEGTVVNSEREVLLTKDEWELVSPNPILYSIYSIKNNQKDSYLTLFDEVSQNIYIMSLNQNKIIYQIDFKNKITKDNTLESIYLHNFDSIFIQQSNSISLIDTKGLEKFNIFINQSNRRNMTMSNKSYGLPLYFDTITNKLLIGQYCSSCGFNDKKYFQQNIKVALDLSTKKFKEIPFSFSNKYQQGYYGFANTAYHIMNDSFSIFSFQADPNIYVYNMKNGNLSVKGGQSSFHSSINELSLTDKNDSNKKMAHLTLSPLYLEILWDPYRKLYYRIFAKAQLERNPDGSYNSWRNKPRVLMVFDENFSLVTEIALDKTFIFFPIFVAEKGLYINAMKEKTLNENTQFFKILKFEK
jgi:Domain of unknown function (DUF4221)